MTRIDNVVELRGARKKYTSKYKNTGNEENTDTWREGTERDNLNKQK